MEVALESSAANGEARALGVGRLRRLLRRRRAVVYAFLASRLGLLTAGLLTQIFIEPIATRTSPLHFTESAALRMWGQWDTGWYMNLASHGYMTQPGPAGQVNWVFFPAYPAISAAVAHLTGLPLFTAMLAVANLSFLAALFLVHQFAEDAFDRRTADIATALICAAPGSYVFSSGYTESLFLLALSACLVLLGAQRWLAAGAFAALAALTRNLGIGLLLPFALAGLPRLWELSRQAAAGRRAGLVEAGRIVLGAALPALALAGFCAFLYLRTGDPLAFVSAQHAWGRSLANPLGRAIAPLATRQLADADVVNFAACWLALGLIAVLLLWRRWSLAALAAFLVLLPLASGLTSFARYSLVAVPVFLAGARLLASRPAATQAVLVVFATLNGVLMVAWTLGLWVAV